MIAIIPARGGSKGIPNKNIKLLNGKPLINWTFEFAVSREIISEIVISTDSYEIIKAIDQLNLSQSEFSDIPEGNVYSIDRKIRVHKRRPEHATDTAPTVLVVNEILHMLNISMDEMVLLLQPTSPFRDKDQFEKICAFPVNKTTSVISVTTASSPHPLKTFKLQQDQIQINASLKKILSSPRQ